MVNDKGLMNGQPVKWKTLGEVTNYEQPTKYLVKTNNYSDKYSIPVLTAGKTFILGYTNETDGIYKASMIPVIIFDDFTTANKWVDFDFKVKSSAMKIITSKDESKVLLKYIFYWLNTLPSGLVNGDHKRQWIMNYSNKQIPIPPLSVQKEIVAILDKFDVLINSINEGLPKEIELRRKQYEYYRDKLLMFNDKGLIVNDKGLMNGQPVEWKALGEVAELKRGSSITKKTANEGKYPVISGGQQPAYFIDQFNRSGETITVAGSGAYAGFVTYWNEPIFVSDAFSIKSDESKVLPRYIFHFLLNIQDKIYDLKAGGGVPHVYAKDVARLNIPIPPLSVQKEIVAILDKFDALINSINEGLPKEIELRRKQYEYYRDKLLMFNY